MSIKFSKKGIPSLVAYQFSHWCNPMYRGPVVYLNGNSFNIPSGFLVSSQDYWELDSRLEDYIKDIVCDRMPALDIALPPDTSGLNVNTLKTAATLTFQNKEDAALFKLFEKLEDTE